MIRFGLIALWTPGHLNPMTTLGHELQRRGHQVTLFGPIDTEASAIAAGLSFCALGESELPRGATHEIVARLGEMKGLSALRHNIQISTFGVNMVLRDAPGAVRKRGIDALLIDQIAIEGETVAEALNIPFITVCNALMLNREDEVPPHFTPWSYNPSWWGRLRNRAGYSLLYRMAQPIKKILNEHRQRWQLDPYSNLSEPFSKLLQLSQQPAEFEFPRHYLPDCFHFTGPYAHPASRKPVDFPFEQLTEKPLIYASLGTVQNRLKWIFHTIAEACLEIDAQLVISLGGSDISDPLTDLPGNPLVVKYAPQLELLQKAALTITHAGMNTTLESLSNGVPMVAIPITNDQPAVAARIASTGTGEVVNLSRLNVPRLRKAVQLVLTEDSYQRNALKLQQAIRRTGGVKKAANLVEQAISTGKPVWREL